MFKRKRLNQFIPGVKTSFVEVYENKAAAELAVENSLNNHLQKELRKWLKQVKIKKQSDLGAAGITSKSVNSFDTLFPDYFEKKAKDIVKNCLLKKIEEYRGNIDSDAFDELFVKDCMAELYEKGCGLYYQGSSTLVFYQDGRYIRALKPNTDKKYAHGLNAKANKKLRIIGAENEFNKNINDNIKPFTVHAPHIDDMKGNQIIWGSRQGVLIVYEKEKGASVAKEIYKVLDALIKETKHKKENDSISNIRPKVNLAGAISKLQDVVSEIKGLRSCQVYFINEEKNNVIKSDLKTNTIDPIDSALLESEKRKEILVETTLSNNYHFKDICIGLGRIFLAHLWTALLFIVITGACLIAGAITFCPIFFVCGVLAFIAGLGVIAYRSNKSINQILKENEPTKEYKEGIITELESGRISDFSLKELTNLKSYTPTENKHDLPDEKPVILNTNPFEDKEIFNSSTAEQKKGKFCFFNFSCNKSDEDNHTKNQKSSLFNIGKSDKKETIKKDKNNHSIGRFFSRIKMEVKCYIFTKAANHVLKKFF